MHSVCSDLVWFSLFRTKQEILTMAGVASQSQVTAGEFLWENIWPKDPAGVSCSR